MDQPYTTDDFLGGLVKLCQLKNGYRATSDAVLLAAAVDAKPGQRILDAGCGTGAVALCIAARCTESVVTGIEIQPEMAEAAAENVSFNGMDSRINIVQADIRDTTGTVPPGVFDWVVTNPPFILEDQISPVKVRDVAHRESDCSLEQWVKSCLRYVGPKGYFVMINRADRLPEILSLLYGRLGGLRIIPVWTKEGCPAKRVIVMGRKDCRSAAVLEKGIVLTLADGSRSQKAESIMRYGESLFDKGLT